MLSYFVKRILLFFPSIFLIGAFAFLLFNATPTDSVASLLRLDGFEEKVISEKLYKSQYKKIASELGLDLPKFYFAFVPRYYPDTLHRIIDKQERKQIVDLLSHHNDWAAVSSFIYQGEVRLQSTETKETKKLITDLLWVVKPDDLDTKLISAMGTLTSPEVSTFLDQAQIVSQQKTSWFIFPKILWFGTSNQYHAWISNFFSGSLGRSVQDGRPVWGKISKALGWTLSLVVLGLSFTILISVPLGIWSARNGNSRMVRLLSNFFYFIYAMPLFWFATLMVVFFTTAHYGNWTNIFPGVGINPYAGDESTVSKILANANQLILPVFCIVLNSIAYLSSIVRNSIIAESNQAYKTTALLKGLTEKATFWKHLFPNALLPLVTIIVGAVPASLAGSLIIEVIFNIPGIGRLMFDSIFGNDWYVIFSIVMLVGVVTVISYLIGDLLYSYLNPRIRFGQANKV